MNDKAKIQIIKLTVATYFGIPAPLLYGRSRPAYLVIPRQIAMALCRELLPEMAWTAIGAAFQRDHANIIHAVKVVKAMVANNRQGRDHMNVLREIIKKRFDEKL